MKQAWLIAFTWEGVVEINRQLCQPKGALHKPTTDGYAPAQDLWRSTHAGLLSFAEATDLCRRCHRLAPFCNFNGNTFAAVIVQTIPRLGLPFAQSVALRSLAGHIVAGIATPEEEKAFIALLARFEEFP